VNFIQRKPFYFWQKFESTFQLLFWKKSSFPIFVATYEELEENIDLLN